MAFNNFTTTELARMARYNPQGASSYFQEHLLGPKERRNAVLSRRVDVANQRAGMGDAGLSALKLGIPRALPTDRGVSLSSPTATTEAMRPKDGRMLSMFSPVAAAEEMGGAGRLAGFNRLATPRGQGLRDLANLSAENDAMQARVARTREEAGQAQSRRLGGLGLTENGIQRNAAIMSSRFTPRPGPEGKGQALTGLAALRHEPGPGINHNADEWAAYFRSPDYAKDLQAAEARSRANAAASARDLGSMTGAEAEARVRANPRLAEGGIFRRNDREAAMQRNRDFIRSGRASMFGPRPATTKGKLKMLEAGLEEKKLAHESRLEGLRQRGGIEKERIAQEGQFATEKLKQSGENYRARGNANSTLQLWREQIAAQQAANNDMNAKLGAKTPEQLEDERFEAEKPYWNEAQWDPDRNEYYRLVGEGDQAKRDYYGKRSQQHLLQDWVDRVAPTKMQYDNAGRFFVPGENGAPNRYLPKSANDAWVQFYAAGGAPGEETQDDEGRWFSRGVPLDPAVAQARDAAREPEFQRLADQYGELLKRQPNGRLPAGYTPVIRPDNYLTAWGSEQPLPGDYKNLRPFELRRIQDEYARRQRTAVAR